MPYKKGQSGNPAGKRSDSGLVILLDALMPGPEIIENLMSINGYTNMEVLESHPDGFRKVRLSR